MNHHNMWIPNFISVAKVSAVIAMGTCVGALLVWYLRKHTGSNFVRVIISRSSFQEKRDPKLGLSFRYNAVDVLLKGEVRCFPVAMFELQPTAEECSRVLVMVEECGADISLEEYKTCSLKDVMRHLSHVTVLSEKNTTLSGHAAVEFEYTHSDAHTNDARRVWVTASIVNRRAYCVQYNSSAKQFRCLKVAQDICRGMQIGASRPGDSFLFFTEPRYGLGLRLPVAYHVDDNMHLADPTTIARFVALHDTSRGGDMLDKSFVDLRVLHGFELRPTIDTTLEGVVATLRQQIEQEISGDNEVLHWKSGAMVESSQSRGGFLLRRAQSHGFKIHNIVLKRTGFQGRYFFYDVVCEADGVTIVIQYIMLVCVHGSEAFVLSAWSEEEHFTDVVANAKECFHSLCLGNQYGQEDSLLYCNPQYKFSMRVPSHFQVHEPLIGDPLVLFTPPNNSTIEDITSTWVTVDSASTDVESTPSMSTVPITVDSQNNPFTVHIRVQDVTPQAKLGDIAAMFVSDIRAAQQVEVEEERSTVIDGVTAREIIYTHVHPDGGGEAVMKCWTVVVLNWGRQYTVQLTTPCDQFRQWRKVYRGMLSSFRFDVR
eukprot:PhM_4_TR11490/c0_g1_i1/m.5944